MFWADILLATRLIEKYGRQHPLLEIGCGPMPCIADYDLTLQTGEQDSRYVRLHQRPFDHIDPEYFTFPREACSSSLEDLPKRCDQSLGCILCFELLHCAPDPALAIRNLYYAAKPGALIVIASLFSYPYGVDEPDYWRCTPDCLMMLGKSAGLTALESGWYLEIPADGRVLSGEGGKPQEVRLAYAAFSKGALNNGEKLSYTLPRRYSDNPKVQRFLEGNAVPGRPAEPIISAAVSIAERPGTLPILSNSQSKLVLQGGSLAGSSSSEYVRPSNLKGPVVLVSKDISFTFPLSYGYLAGYLRQQGEDVRILFRSGDSNVLVRQIMELKPLLVGFGSLFPELKEIREIIQLLNKAGRDFPVIVGGQMVSPTPEFAVQITGADFGAVGEAEITLYKLVCALRQRHDPAGVKGLVIKAGQEYVLTGAEDYFEDLSTLPPIPYALFPTEKWLPIGRFYALNVPCPHWRLEDRVINVHGGRGCPFKCNFCYHHSKPRYRPIPNMMAEAAEALDRFNGNMLYFSDDLVISSPRRAEELINHIRNLGKPIEYSISTRFDLLARMDDGLLAEMKASGCRIMGLGIESGSDRILKIVGKNCTAESILTQLERLKRFDILPTVSIMLGQYTETLEDVEASIKLMCESVRSNVNINYFFSATTPYPGTALYKIAKEKGLIRDEQHFYDLFFETGAEFQQVVNLSAMSMEEVRAQLERIRSIYEEEKSKAPARKMAVPKALGRDFTQIYQLPFEIDCLLLDWNQSVLFRCRHQNIDWAAALEHFKGPLFGDLLALALRIFPQLNDRWQPGTKFNISPFARPDLKELPAAGEDFSQWFVIYTGDPI